jgi:hypothetical protein
LRPPTRNRPERPHGPLMGLLGGSSDGLADGRTPSLGDRGVGRLQGRPEGERSGSRSSPSAGAVTAGLKRLSPLPFGADALDPSGRACAWRSLPERGVAWLIGAPPGVPWPPKRWWHPGGW